MLGFFRLIHPATFYHIQSILRSFSPSVASLSSQFSEQSFCSKFNFFAKVLMQRI
jgi:hypothetical protein